MSKKRKKKNKKARAPRTYAMTDAEAGQRLRGGDSEAASHLARLRHNTIPVHPELKAKRFRPPKPPWERE